MPAIAPIQNNESLGSVRSRINTAFEKIDGAAQVSELASVAFSGDASDLAEGILPTSRLDAELTRARLRILPSFAMTAEQFGDPTHVANVLAIRGTFAWDVTYDVARVRDTNGEWPLTNGWMVPYAIANNVNDNTAAVQHALNYSRDVFLPRASWVISTVTVPNSFSRFVGAGPDKTRIRTIAANDDGIVVGTPGVTNVSTLIQGFTIYGTGEQTGGAHIRFAGIAVTSIMLDVEVHNFYTGIRGHPNVAYWNRVRCHQQQQPVEAVGKHSFHFDIGPNGEYATDVHGSDWQLSGFKDQTTWATESHIYIQGCDGLYLSGNSHAFWAKHAMVFDPSLSNASSVIASVVVSGFYLDTNFKEHVVFGGTATAYRKIYLGGCQLRAGNDNDASSIVRSGILVDAPVDRLHVTNNTFDNLDGCGVEWTTNGATSKSCIVAHNTFTNCNNENDPNNGDIIVRGQGHIIGPNIHDGGGADGYAVRLMGDCAGAHVTTGQTLLSTAVIGFEDNGTDNWVDGAQRTTSTVWRGHKYLNGEIDLTRDIPIDVTTTDTQIIVLPFAHLGDRSDLVGSYSLQTVSNNTALDPGNVKFAVVASQVHIKLIAAGTSTDPASVQERITARVRGIWKLPDERPAA